MENIQPITPQPSFLQLHKKKIIIAVVVLLMLFTIGLLLLFSNKKEPISTDTSPKATPSITQPPQQKSFEVISTFPQDKQQNVSNGEIIISFATNTPILSESAFTLSINPALPENHSLKVINTYPTEKVEVRVLGGFSPNTTYTFSVTDNTTQKIIKTWSFTTSSESAESAPQLLNEQQEERINKYYPLFDVTPHTTADYSINYTGRLTLEVQVKNKTKDLEEIKKEVTDWIRSNGVDPATHTINYTNTP